MIFGTQNSQNPLHTLAQLENLARSYCDVFIRGKGELAVRRFEIYTAHVYFNEGGEEIDKKLNSVHYCTLTSNVERLIHMCKGFKPHCQKDKNT